MTRQEFIKAVAEKVREYAPSYGIRVHSPIIAQAILESRWGESRLAKVYHNYHGLKCGSRWKGKSVNLATQEEYTTGTLTTIKDNFRVYDSFSEGIKGYFDFIQLPRYENLKGVTDPQEYLQLIKRDGYATDSQYVEKNMKIVEQYGLTRYDNEEKEEMKIQEKEITICGHGSGTPSIKNLNAYNTYRYGQVATNGKRKSLVSVKRLKALTDAQRTEFRRKYNTIVGRNAYNQSLRNYVYKARPKDGKYYSDCSSSGMATYKEIGAYDGDLLNTAGIYRSSLFEDVPVNIDSTGHITNPEILKIGDALLYRGNDSSRPLQIGHVEFVHTMPSTDKYQQGWNVDARGWWYADTGNSYSKSTWKAINGHWYYFDDEGYILKGLQVVNGKLYYFTESGDLEGALMHTDGNGALVEWKI